MDAISFVLGIKSAQLRSTQLKDLIYRGRRLAEEPADGTDEREIDDGGEDAAKAWVLAVYQDASGKEYRFQRTYVNFLTLAEYTLLISCALSGSLLLEVANTK
jgi:structural maintenance of chromosome 1